MCISFEASVIAYTIGLLSGASIFYNSYINKSNAFLKVIGLFIIFYSQIQLLEALIYKNNNFLWSRLILANISLQGFIFFALIKYYNIFKSIYTNLLLFITLLISLYGIYKSFTLKQNEKAKFLKYGIEWPFSDYYLALMYFFMFLFLFISKNNLVYIVGLFFFITFILASYVSYLNMLKHTPGLWCWFSAITAPLLYYFLKFNNKFNN